MFVPWPTGMFHAFQVVAHTIIVPPRTLFILHSGMIYQLLVPMLYYSATTMITSASSHYALTVQSIPSTVLPNLWSAPADVISTPLKLLLTAVPFEVLALVS